MILFMVLENIIIAKKKDLPYWESHLLLHCLDVIHIEKNFFYYLMNTILIFQGKTKNNLKSKLDKVDICVRPNFMLMSTVKVWFPYTDWMQLRKKCFFIGIQTALNSQTVMHQICVIASTKVKFSDLKSYNCHVMMYRLFPFVFSGLLPWNFHEAMYFIF